MTSKKKVALTKEDAKKIYFHLYLFRRFEETVAQLYRTGKIAGFCHLYIGQEAVLAGIHFNMHAQDSIITTYRDHVHALVYGGTIKSVLAELCGKKQGMIGGKGGSMHFFDKDHKFYGGQAIVGTTVPLGAGAALAHKYNKDGGVNVAYIGDGAVLQGQVAEALNMAALWKLPLLVVVENNQYAMGTSVERSHANEDISALAVPYNIKAIKVDGMDVMDVITKSRLAFDHIRAGNGPVLLDVNTYRYRGHSMSDPAKYRNRDEVDTYRDKNDPILNFANYAMTNKLLDQSTMEQIRNEIEGSIQEVDGYLKTTTEPDANELYDYLYA